MRSDAMTPEDLAQIAAIVDAAEQRITAAGEARAQQAARNMQEALDRAAQTIHEETSTDDARTIEATRDMQSEILRGIEAFARGNFARMVRLEHADAATTERLATIEQRLLDLETPPAATHPLTTPAGRRTRLSQRQQLVVELETGGARLVVARVPAVRFLQSRLKRGHRH